MLLALGVVLLRFRAPGGEATLLSGSVRVGVLFWNPHALFSRSLQATTLVEGLGFRACCPACSYAILSYIPPFPSIKAFVLGQVAPSETPEATLAKPDNTLAKSFQAPVKTLG